MQQNEHQIDNEILVHKILTGVLVGKNSFSVKSDFCSFLDDQNASANVIFVLRALFFCAEALYFVSKSQTIRHRRHRFLILLCQSKMPVRFPHPMQAAKLGCRMDSFSCLTKVV